MTKNYRLVKDQTGLLIVDVQERLFLVVDQRCEMKKKLQRLVRGFQILKRPIFATEQYPEGLGSTAAFLRNSLGEDQHYWSKCTFSCMGDPALRQEILKLPLTQWVIAGIEAHVCVLQTVRDLLNAQKQVVVVNDAIASRSIYDFSTAIAEMRDCGARISSMETVLFELLENSKTPGFKEILDVVKAP